MACVMCNVKPKRKKKNYHCVKCSKCSKEMASNATGICFACRTSLCECGRRYTKQAGSYKPENKCSVCRKAKTKHLSRIGLEMINNAIY